MKEIGKPFEDLNSYNNSMSKAMEDKLFFVEKLPVDRYTFVDFGCADGTMIKHLIKIYGSDCRYIGYDCSETMIALAKENFDLDTPAEVLFTTDWDLVAKYIGRKSVLILSSVIHEVYSYSDEEDLRVFWKRVKESGFGYIVFRDMIARKSMDSREDYRLANNVRDRRPRIATQFEEKYGSLEKQKNLIHFLLKYRWTINWERELNENYFPICLEELLEIFKEFPYQLQYLESFKIPVLEERVMKDFGIEFPENTHAKLIFKRV